MKIYTSSSHKLWELSPLGKKLYLVIEEVDDEFRNETKKDMGCSKSNKRKEYYLPRWIHVKTFHIIVCRNDQVRYSSIKI